MIDKNIFENLENLKIPYCIGVAKSKLKKAFDKKESFGSDYFIGVPFNTSNLILEFLGFNLNTHQNHKQLIEYTLEDFEIDIFKKNLDKYKMVSNNIHGIIYEPKNVSLKDYFNKIKK